MVKIYKDLGGNNNGSSFYYVRHVHTDDNAINVDVLPPQQADGNATNPEQLFAAGYASCFNGAFDLILKQNKVRDAEPEVTLTVRLEDDPNAESPKLSVDIDAKVKNVLSQEDAENIYKMHMSFVHIQKQLAVTLM